MEETIGIQRKKKKGFTSFYTRGEEIFNAVSHIVGGGVGVLILIIGLIFSYPSPAAMISIIVFSVSVITLYTMSALYHFLPDGRAKGVFRIFDHCTIFFLIAGTYTPFCVLLLGWSAAGITIFCLEWGLAVLGITGNAIAMKNRVIKILSMIFYVIMGWAIIAVLPILLKTMSAAAFWLLLLGGLCYTVGIAFFALGKKVRYFHSVWHLFDIAGTVLQFVSILLIL